jgi:hypothetical protein
MENAEPRPVEQWTREELIRSVHTLLDFRNASMEIIGYVQGNPGVDHDELMRRVAHLAGVYYLSPPLPGE